MSEHNKRIIERYIEAYNLFDIEGMLRLMHEQVLFRNYSNGVMDTETRGMQQFGELAAKSAKMFSSRCQTITNYSAIADQAEVQIDYEAILATDLPNGLKSGDKIQLKGKSVFEIQEGKILVIEDYS
ncbi:nuclear transport factor 2 family protein [Paenibacillus sp. PR3]|uniref:Nuclear transport factor 2 family protein n=1 Tax=Paenibacillus terricola TaxID=2763503 RepID=A0ABR8N1N9_9BACL|nr:nuclear transport factor 2 family protein [Paenibacillus terricola]MBD3922082.1 nuclear transport factor 2 family protein [Paenibacillus terricola]